MSSGSSFSGGAAVSARWSVIDLPLLEWARDAFYVLTAITVVYIVCAVIDRYIQRLVRQKSLETLFKAVDLKLKAALLATGSAQINAAAALVAEVQLRFGPLLGFAGPLAGALKDLGEVARGRVKQVLVCNCGRCVCGVPEPPTVTVSTPGASASAASAGGGAASASAVGGGSTVVSGGAAPRPLTTPERLPCHCGRGEPADAPRTPPPAAPERAMTTEEQTIAARQAIEKFANLWHESTVIGQLRAIDRALAAGINLKLPRSIR
jgi:hypothetical protein